MSNFICAIITILAIMLTAYWGIWQKGILEFIAGLIIFWLITLPWIMNLIEEKRK